MLTPPYHHSIVAAPLSTPPHDISTEILYRGSIPVQRNLPFINRLHLHTVVYLRAKELAPSDILSRWCSRKGVELRWIKASEMGEEKLGVGKNEITEVLKVILDRSNYPLYLADIDGISHTTLVIACLRKLQGWHVDSIIDEICQFEPEHEEYSLVPFITTYLSSPDSSFVLPSTSYPSWIWPTSGPTGAPQMAPLARTSTRDRSQSTVNPPPANPLLPFPHPLQSRRHPTMKIMFPSAPNTQANTTSSPLLPSSNPNTLTRVPSRYDKSPASGEENRAAAPQPSLVGAATQIISSGVSGIIPALGGTGAKNDEGDRTLTTAGGPKAARLVSFSADSPSSSSRISSSPENASPPAIGSGTDLGDPSAEPISEITETETSEGGSVAEIEDDDEEEDDEYDEDEEEEDDDDDLQPTSQYISALDLAGFA